MTAGRAAASILLAAALLIGAAVPPPLMAQAAVQAAPASIPAFAGDLHAPSGFRFPDRVDGFVRTDGLRFAKDNLAVGYEQPGDGGDRPFLTLYVYPAPGPLAEEAAGVREAIVQRWPTRPFVPSPSAAPDGVQVSEWFEADVDGATWVTAFALTQRDGWSIKVRVTAPRDAATIALLQRAIAAVDWTARLKPREG